MIALFAPDNPEDTRYTLTITMPLKEWLVVRKQLEAYSSYEGNKLVKAVNDMVSQAERVFWPSPEQPSTTGE